VTRHLNRVELAKQRRLEVKRLDPRAQVPRYHSDGASGLDLRALDEVSAHTSEDGERLRAKLPRCIHAGESMLLGTGIAVAIPPGHEAQIRPRSSLAARHSVIATLGTIDVDYRGELLVQLVNHGPQSFVVHEGDRVAQLVVAPVARVDVVEVDALDATARGAGGLGSTGAR
jgi:dUTP pyrophosphatase